MWSECFLPVSESTITSTTYTCLWSSVGVPKIARTSLLMQTDINLKQVPDLNRWPCSGGLLWVNLTAGVEQLCHLRHCAPNSLTSAILCRTTFAAPNSPISAVVRRSTSLLRLEAAQAGVSNAVARTLWAAEMDRIAWPLLQPCSSPPLAPFYSRIEHTMCGSMLSI